MFSSLSDVFFICLFKCNEAHFNYKVNETSLWLVLSEFTGTSSCFGFPDFSKTLLDFGKPTPFIFNQISRY